MQTIHKPSNQQSDPDKTWNLSVGNCLNTLCPNCGSAATRKHFHQSTFVETACKTCDYFLISCRETGRVIEAYAPGIRFNKV